MSLCKVVYGSCATGWRDRTTPMSYMDCVSYLRDHENEIAPQDDSDGPYDPHYSVGLDIIDCETGRLMSWVL